MNWYSIYMQLLACQISVNFVQKITGYRQNLPVTGRSAAPTNPVLTAGSPFTELVGYREISCSHEQKAT